MSQPMRAGTCWRLLLLTLLAVSRVDAAPFVVDSTLDEVDATPGDGTCATVSGACTLRAAVQESNAVPGPDVITVPPGTYLLSIPGRDEWRCATGDLDVLDELAINGAGNFVSIIDAGGIDRIVESIATLSLTGLTLSGGDILGGGGAIVDLGRGAGLTIEGCTFERNRAGAIGAASPLIVRDCTFRLNESGNGGAIECSGPFTITGSTFDQNRASVGFGGALALWINAVGSIEDCTFTDNHSTRFGGAIAAGWGDGTPVHVILRRVTISGCTAAGGIESTGGAIHLGQDGWPSTVAILDSVITGNRADVAGGAISIERSFAFGYGITVVNSTISGNSAPRGGAVSGGAFVALNSTIAYNDAPIAAGIEVLPGLPVELGRSILFGNTGGSDCDGTIVSRGHNLFGTATPCTITGDTTTDLFGVDPLLGSLQDNGGPTFTHDLFAGSPAIDAAADTCVDETGIALVADQRGAERPVDGDGDTLADCDIGAVETCGIDSDGDTLGDTCDCAPADPATLRIPAEADVRIAKAAATDDAILSWTDLAPRAGTSTLYDVASDAIGVLWTARVASGPCIATGIIGPWIDARAVIDRGWYYLVRGVNPCGPPLGQGWGSASLGAPRPACP